MRYTKRLAKVWTVVGLFLSLAGAAKGNDSDTVIMRPYASSMHFWEEYQHASDSITHYWWGEKRYFNRDSLFARCARLGADSVREELHFYCADILDAIRDPEERRIETRKMREAIQRYGPHKLRIVSDFCEAFVMPDSTEALFDAKMKRFVELSVHYAALGDTQHELEALRYTFVKSFNYQNYSKAFYYAVRLEKRLEEVTPADYSGWYADWFELGNAYYEFGDYERAIPLLKKALREEPVPNFFDRYNLRARNTLGVYYRDQGDLDCSDAYFLSMLESRDWVKFRPMYDCIAVSNLATNQRRRGNFGKALALHRLALPRSISEMDWSFTSGIYVGLAECYLETGALTRCKTMIDSTFYYINLVSWPMPYRLAELYPIIARYYAAIGETALSLAYMDSTTAAHHRQDEAFNSLKILRAKQELFEWEQMQKEIQVDKLRRLSLVAGTTALIIFIALLILFIFYRKKHQAYRLLAARTREWAERTPDFAPPPPQADATDIDLMQTINDLMEKERLYLDPDLRLETLSERLGIHRNYVSKAINIVGGKSFVTYVNECRVRHAIRLLTDPANDSLSLETIALDAGFPSRTTFYRVFKAQTKINPATYRQNRETGVVSGSVTC